MHIGGQADSWWQVQRQRLSQKAPTHGDHSPDLTDILLSHLHVDDNGVDLAVHQLPHSPCTQLQQAVLLFRQRQTDRQSVYSWAHPSLLHPPCHHLPGDSSASSAKNQKKLETQTHACAGGRSGSSGPPSPLSSPSATPLQPQPTNRIMEVQE